MNSLVPAALLFSAMLLVAGCAGNSQEGGVPPGEGELPPLPPDSSVIGMAGANGSPPLPPADSAVPGGAGGESPPPLPPG